MIGVIFLVLLCISAVVITFSLCKVSAQSEALMETEYENFMLMKGNGK